MPVPERIRELNQGLVDAFNRRDAAGAACFYADHATLFLLGLPEPATGRAAIAAEYAELFRGFPDITMKLTGEVVEGDTAAVEWLMVGTQTGTLEGGLEPIPPTGRKVELRGAAVFKVNPEGKLMEHHIYFDQVSRLQQLGVMPGPASGPRAHLP